MDILVEKVSGKMDQTILNTLKGILKGMSKQGIHACQVLEYIVLGYTLISFDWALSSFLDTNRFIVWIPGLLFYF